MPIGPKLIGASLRFETRHVEEVVDHSETWAPREAAEFVADFRDVEAEILTCRHHSVTTGRSIGAIVHGKLA